MRIYFKLKKLLNNILFFINKRKRGSVWDL